MKFLERFFRKKKQKEEQKYHSYDLILNRLNRLPDYSPENKKRIKEIREAVENETINTLASTLGEKSKCQN